MTTKRSVTSQLLASFEDEREIEALSAEEIEADLRIHGVDPSASIAFAEALAAKAGAASGPVSAVHPKGSAASMRKATTESFPERLVRNGDEAGNVKSANGRHPKPPLAPAAEQWPRSAQPVMLAGVRSTRYPRGNSSFDDLPKPARRASRAILSGLSLAAAAAIGGFVWLAYDHGVPSLPVDEELLVEAPSPRMSPAADALVEASPVSTTDGSYHVELAAVQDEADARRALDQFQSAFGSLVSPLASYIQRLDTGAGVFYRLQIGPLASRSDAQALCDRLKQHGAGCFVASAD